MDDKPSGSSNRTMNLSRKARIAIGGGSVIALAVIIAVICVLTIKKDGQVDRSGAYSFEEFLSSNFSSEVFGGTWRDSNTLQFRQVDGTLATLNVETGEVKPLVDKNITDQVPKNATFVSFSPDGSYFLFLENKEAIWRHSFLADYLVLDDKGNQYRIHPKSGDDTDKIRYLTWRPGTSEIIYVFQNNIFWKEDLKQDKSKDVQLTKTGNPDPDNLVYNGIPDWVYEEEVLGTNNALYFTSDGSKLAYASLDDSKVKTFVYNKYGVDPEKNQYPETIELKYPKPGTPNPVLQLYVLDGLKENPTQILVQPPDIIGKEEHIYARCAWISNEALSVIWYNRVQNYEVNTLCENEGGQYTCKVKDEQKENSGWVDFHQPIYSKDGKLFVQIQSQKGSDRSFMHIAVVSDGPKKFLTEGNFVVTEILAWDEDQDVIYFMATDLDQPGTRHLYQAKRVRTGKDKNFKCITCHLNLPGLDKPCLYNSVDISKGFKYYVHTCQGPSVPQVFVRALADHSIKKTLVDNKDLKDLLKTKTLPKKEFLTVEITGKSGLKYQVPVIMYLPPSLDKSKKYPFLLHIYGGPQSQIVDYKWSIGWGDFLATNYGVIYAEIDGRGTGFKSNEYTFEVYESFGTVEVEDNINVTRNLTQMYPYIDKEKTGIWGWSYGGFLILKTLVRDEEEVFKCGLAVAPPSNWMFYDTIYTERYMRLPDPGDNEKGYKESSLLDKVEKLRGKKFMINHGVADDNVHLQHSLMLIRLLELADIQFVQNFYTDESHSLSGVRRHLYHQFDSFLSSCYGYTSVIPTNEPQ